MSERVLVIGGGGREHALCWKLAQSKDVAEVYVSPGNIGIARMQKVEVVSLDIKNFQEIADWCVQNKIDLVVVGPEDPLAGGIADVLSERGISCFGPKKNAARIEADKCWAKHFMQRHGIPTAQWDTFTDTNKAKKFIENASFPALVVKASGLAAGKGVVVAASCEEACQAVDDILEKHQFGAAGETVVIEELLQGEEVSVLAFCDGKSVKVMLPSQDHKRLLDGDSGPNTGGMGAYCPCPILSTEELKIVEKEILQKTVDGLCSEGMPFVGVLYAGLMITDSGPKVLEFNCRFGDPETQVIIPLLESDLFNIMRDCCSGCLRTNNLKWKDNQYAVGVVMASSQYPQSSTKGETITGIEKALSLPGVFIFHSGTAQNSNGQLVTNGGRVLIAVSVASELTTAAANSTAIATCVIKFNQAQFRKDIAHKGIARSLLQRGNLTYKSSGVDIVAGDTLVNKIKSTVSITKRSGLISDIGGFGGVFDIAGAGYKEPLLVSGTDGVGTKLKVAQEYGLHSTIGIDLVAMCVNDILAHGAEPLFFLDYFSSSHLDVDVTHEVIAGIAEGCRQANCALIGGETAEMPGLYAKGDYDLAGFAVGAVERSKLLPLSDKIVPGDVVILVPSSGLHSNGFSLVRKVIEKSGSKYTDHAPFSEEGKTFGYELLTPTKIYVKSLLPVLKSGKVKAFAHITGGGLIENIPRVLPKNVCVKLDAHQWKIPPVFAWIAAIGGVREMEMLKTFNCGVGAVLIVNSNDKEFILQSIVGEVAVIGGTVEALKSDEPRVVVHNFVNVMEKMMQPYISSLVLTKLAFKKRVGVLISGSGTNLQALIDATKDESQEIGAEIVLVISNKDHVEGLQRAQRAGIPTKVIKHTAYASRLEFDMAVHDMLTASNVDIVCLAGFMRVLTGDFVKLWRGHLINIHPALLPLFKGTHAHRQALEAGVRVTGCTAHFVEEDVDAGAILVQEAVQIELNDTEETLQERVKVLEHIVFPKALKLVATGKVSLNEEGKLEWK